MDSLDAIMLFLILLNFGLAILAAPLLIYAIFFMI